MKQLTITSVFSVYNSLNELPSDIQQLFEKAIEARKNAYAPYSNFQVGTAFLLENGQIITGNNQENAAYPSGMCAERVAVWKASSEYPNVKIKQIAITATSIHKPVTEPIPPCGACRQTLSEYEVNQKSPMEIYFMGETGEILKADSLKAILPLMFDKNAL